MADLQAAPGRCQEAHMASRETYIPCNRPAVKLIGYKGSAEGPYRMCEACADHNLRNRNGVDRGPYKAEPSFSDAQLVGKYVDLRAKLKAEQEAFDERMKPLKGALETIGNVLQATLVSRGADSTKTENGTAYLSTTYRSTVTDPAAFRKYIVESGNLDMFTNSVSKEAVEAYLEKNGALPPGVTRTGFTTCNVRKA